MFFFDNLGACICSQIVKLKAVMCQYVYVSPAPLTAFITQTSLMLLTKSRFFSINLLTFFIYFFFLAKCFGNHSSRYPVKNTVLF